MERSSGTSRDRDARGGRSDLGRVTAEETRRFARQAASLRDAETDDPGTPEQRRELLHVANTLRAASGRAPLPDDEEDPPELGFYRRAAALGMAFRHRTAAR